MEEYFVGVSCSLNEDDMNIAIVKNIPELDHAEWQTFSYYDVHSGKKELSSLFFCDNLCEILYYEHYCELSKSQAEKLRIILHTCGFEDFVTIGWKIIDGLMDF